MAETKTLKLTVKETVDFVYEILTSNPEGTTMSAKSLFGKNRKIMTILVNRGIVDKKKVAARGRRGYECLYKWVASMPPTKVLYGSIADELRDKRREYKKSYLERKRCRTESDAATPIQIQKTEVVAVPAPGLSMFPSQDLWDELKRRGYNIEIEDCRLVVVRKEYLN